MKSRSKYIEKFIEKEVAGMLFFPELGIFNSAFIWSLSYFMDEKSFVNSAKAGIHIVP